MKKLMTMILAIIPVAMMAQGSKNVSTHFSNTNTDVASAYEVKEMRKFRAPNSNVSPENSSDNAMFMVTDDLLADPNFDIQENMISYTKDQKTVYFSANNALKEKKDELRIKKSVQLQMFKADVAENGEWENLEMLPFNGKSHSTGHPALNKDDTQLYFVSDGPGSTGKTDIFVVDLLEDGSYGKPANLGSKVNSEEREVFPMMDESDVLYFASDIDTDGDELNVFASEIIDEKATTSIKLEVAASGNKEDYVAAFNAVDAEAMRIAEEAADMRDLEILLEAESLTEIERVKEVFAETMEGSAYNFDSDNTIYTIQIGAFVKNANTNDYKDSAVLFNHTYDDGYNRYYSGSFQSVEAAEGHLKQMKKEGYKDAFVIGLTGTKRFLP